MIRLMVLVIALGAVTVPLAALAQSVNGPAYEKPLSAQAVHDVQARLKALGYYGGPVDGAWGPLRAPRSSASSAIATSR